MPTLAEIDRCLPQTQCTECGFPSCQDYAQALLNKKTQINRCPPGSEVTLTALKKWLHGSATQLADDCQPYTGRQVARIIESRCIGCTLCIDPCPVDAIVGAPKQMHSILMDDCTGCSLCVSACPVDCIEMDQWPVARKGETWPEFLDVEVNRWRTLANRRRQRSMRNSSPIEPVESTDIKREILQAINRERTQQWKKKQRRAAFQTNEV